MRKTEETLLTWIAWRLPRKLVYWCVIRVWVHATTGRWSRTNPATLSVDKALERWEKK